MHPNAAAHLYNYSQKPTVNSIGDRKQIIDFGAHATHPLKG
jgi:hypothetical protein